MLIGAAHAVRGIVGASLGPRCSPLTRRPAASPTPQRSSQPTTVGWIAIIVFAFLAGLGAIAAVATVGVYVALASPDGMPDPRRSTNYVLPQETVIFDRTRSPGSWPASATPAARS